MFIRTVIFHWVPTTLHSPNHVHFTDLVSFIVICTFRTDNKWNVYFFDPKFLQFNESNIFRHDPEFRSVRPKSGNCISPFTFMSWVRRRRDFEVDVCIHESGVGSVPFATTYLEINQLHRRLMSFPDRKTGRTEVGWGEALDGVVSWQRLTACTWLPTRHLSLWGVPRTWDVADDVDRGVAVLS